MVRIAFSFIRLTVASRRTSTLSVKDALPSSGWTRFALRTAADSRRTKFGNSKGLFEDIETLF